MNRKAGGGPSVRARLRAKAEELGRSLAALGLAYKRKDVPRAAKLIILAALVYALSPVDLIPDFIPVAGLIDELIILPFLIMLSIKLIPPRILQECREQARGMKKNSAGKKWRYALPFITIQLAAVAFLFYIIIV